MNKQYKYASTQVDLSLIMQGNAIRSSLEIPSTDLGINGREKQPHITIRYGLMDVNPDVIRSAVKDIQAFMVGFGPMNKFRSTNNINDDVLYCEVVDVSGAGGLSGLRKRLSQFDHPESQSKNFVPHVTLAYVLPGRVDWLVDQPCILTGKTMAVDTIMFCTKDGGRFECSLKSPEKLVKPVDIYKFYTQNVQG